MVPRRISEIETLAARDRDAPMDSIVPILNSAHAMASSLFASLTTHQVTANSAGLAALLISSVLAVATHYLGKAQAEARVAAQWKASFEASQTIIHELTLRLPVQPSLPPETISEEKPVPKAAGRAEVSPTEEPEESSERPDQGDVSGPLQDVQFASVIELIDRMGIRKSDLAKSIGVHPSTVSRYISGTAPLPVGRRPLLATWLESIGGEIPEDAVLLASDGKDITWAARPQSV